MNLCGKQRGCCAKIIKVRSNEFHISDDFGGLVLITRKELEMLQEYNPDESE